MKDKLIKVFKVPKEVETFIDKIISSDEEKIIVEMGSETYSFQQLKELIAKKLDIEPEEFIKDYYKRNIIDKVNCENKIFYKISNLYCRLAVFAQFEVDTWNSIDLNLREKADAWYVSEYAVRSKDKVDRLKNGELSAIENAYFITLEESLNLIENKEADIYLLPCNCKAIAKNCKKPINVCIQFENKINTMADRGWGEKISKQKAKEIIINANKSGLMHSSECESALCNCDGCCCYTIRAAKALGVEKQWPKKIHKINWDENMCINCGKCSKICNFNAFTINNKFVNFDDSKCWGCTICKDNCPTKAITLEY